MLSRLNHFKSFTNVATHRSLPQFQREFTRKSNYINRAAHCNANQYSNRVLFINIGRRYSTSSEDTKKDLRICVFDVSDRIQFHEGQLIQNLFQLNDKDPSLPKISADVFAIKYDHWPIADSDVSLLLVDEYLNQNKDRFLSNQLVDRLIPEERLPSVDSIMEYIEHNYDGIAISGSDDSCMNDSLPYLKILLPLIRKCVTNKDFPLFGICFGAQAIIRALKGDSGVSTMHQQGKEHEYGFLKYKIIKKNQFLDGISDTFVSTAYHGDCFLLDEEEKLVVSETWDNQAYQIPDRKCFGVQFHPEFPKEFGLKIFEDLLQTNKEARVVRDASGPDDEPGVLMAKNFIKIILDN
ncbi:GMP synthase guaA [Acrasis kona]|uniref:GMP synthase guaA n=1 Tax=Acrasis kona TaxID=1008807 RepID=A0AAW2Z7X9_9EUKA